MGENVIIICSFLHVETINRDYFSTFAIEYYGHSVISFSQPLK